MKDNQLIRKEFEEWYGSKPKRIKNGLYKSKFAQSRWEAWQDCANHYEAKIAELEAQLPVWRDIDSAPKDGTTILVYPHTNGIRVGEAFWYSQQWRSEYDREYPDVWQPLPKPPAHIEKGQEQ